MRMQLTVGLIFATLFVFSGCATFRSDLHGGYTGEVKRNMNAEPVSVTFAFTHVEQTIGYDAIPKVVNTRRGLSGFDDLFTDALREFSNVDRYATYSDDANDVNNPTRRAMKDSLLKANDYSIRMRFSSEQRFSRKFLGVLFSTISVTLLPVSYSEEFTLVTEVYKKRELVASYRRSASLNKWVEMFLVFIYPFHPENRKREEIYMMMMHDTFRAIESEQKLK